MQSFMEKNQKPIIYAVISIAALLGIFLIFAIVTQIESLKYIGSGLAATNTITVDGHGEVDKAPDTANFSFTIQDEESTTAAAQTAVSTKITKVKNDLLAAGIPEEDITTNSYNSYPDYVSNTPICMGGACAGSTSQTLKGYIVSEEVDVSVKDLSKTETVAGLLGNDGVTNIDGPNLGFADPHEATDEARDKAILDAKVQAEKLAQSLGVKLVRIVSFTDNSNNGTVMPVTYGARAMAVGAPAATPNIPTGVQTITSDVSITYEIR
jgi:uncharacterized protein YggE